MVRVRLSITWGISCAPRYQRVFHAKSKTEYPTTSPSTKSNSITFTLKPPTSKTSSTTQKSSFPSTPLKSPKLVNAQRLSMEITIAKIFTLIFIMKEKKMINLISSLPIKNLLRVALPTFCLPSTCTNPRIFHSRPSWKMAKNKPPLSCYFSKTKSTANWLSKLA